MLAAWATRLAQLKEFDGTAEVAFKMLEAKSRFQYYARVHKESLARQKTTRDQAHIVAVYCRQLEKKYQSVLRAIQDVKNDEAGMTAVIEGILPDLHETLGRASLLDMDEEEPEEVEANI